MASTSARIVSGNLQVGATKIPIEGRSAASGARREGSEEARPARDAGTLSPRMPVTDLVAEPVDIAGASNWEKTVAAARPARATEGGGGPGNSAAPRASLIP